MHRLLPTTLVVLVLAAAAGAAEENLDASLKKAALDYAGRLDAASAELTRAREGIAREKAPLLRSMRAAEDRIIEANAKVTQLETGKDDFVNRMRQLTKDSEALRKNLTYLATLAHDSLNAYDEGCAPGERPLHADALRTLGDALAATGRDHAGNPADVAAFLADRVTEAIGGYAVPGSALVEGDNRIVAGRLAFVGPEVFFRSDAGGPAGTVRQRTGSDEVVAYPLAQWPAASAEAFFAGRAGTIMADASSGKALRLAEARGTVWQHINKGGAVSYAILAVGLLSLVLIASKVRDLLGLRVATVAAVRPTLVALVTRGSDAAAAEAARLGRSTRELLETGLALAGAPKEEMEDALDAVLLRERLRYERRLPLLAVIATAAPLMGLLGTVTGMVRTFSLITVFGTGNAGKLAGGISEVLVATELGLLVAIPTLITHGFLSHRIQKNLSLLECHAADLVTAAQRARRETDAPETLAV